MYRIHWPIQAMQRALAEEGKRLDVKLIEPTSIEADQSFRITRHPQTLRVSAIEVPDDCTGILIQRPTSESLVETFKMIKSQSNISLLIDVDDDLTALSPRHAAFQVLHPSHKSGHNAHVARQACEIADLVLASTPAILETHAVANNGVLLRNRLPAHLRPSSQTEGGGGCGAHPQTAPRVSAPHYDVSNDVSTGPELVVGWPGSLDTHPDDLRDVFRALGRLSRSLSVLGPKPSHATAPPDTTFLGQVPFDDWISRIHDTIDIGVAPLEPSDFNRAKSWLKPLELSAAGLPFVASRTEEYEALGAGLLASSHKEWAAQLKRLIGDRDLRHAESIRNTSIAEACTYDAHIGEWLRVFRPWVVPADSDLAL